MADYKENIIPHSHAIKLADRIRKNKYEPKLIWFTGLSGSGKSTLASAAEAHFFENGINTYILDGDNVRGGLNSDLDFTDASRRENIRRISEVSNLFLDAGLLVFTAFISPFKQDRTTARALVGAKNFIEVYVDCPLEVCEERDVKGLYKKAREGKLENFTGISSPFEIPENPDVVLNTADNSLQDCLRKLIEEIEQKITS
ncbi:MAG: adenylyl-sulfate kinase [Ekhidna sp.]